MKLGFHIRKQLTGVIHVHAYTRTSMN